MRLFICQVFFITYFLSNKAFFDVIIKNHKFMNEKKFFG